MQGPRTTSCVLNPIWRVVLWSLSIITCVAVSLVLFFLWNLLLWPTSPSEAFFRYRLNAAAKRGTPEIRLYDVAPFDWQEVCMNGAYAGDWRYDKYRRVYEDMTHSEGQETWVFIRADGRPTYFMYYGGMAGVQVSHITGCWSRSNAVMVSGAGQGRYTMVKPDL
jgi:hypothetical protein